MQSTRNDGRFAWRRWYQFRQEARETAMSKEEFSPIEQSKYNLDTAGIDGGTNPETFELDPYDHKAERIDYRDVDPIHD